MNSTKFDPAKPVQTRDGRKARIVCTDSKHMYGEIRQPIIAEVEVNESCKAVTVNYTESGRLFNDQQESHYDLVNIPRKHTCTCWVNVYSDGYATYHTSRLVADACANANRVACKQITFEVEEGEGV